jgi:hypothetical protein
MQEHTQTALSTHITAVVKITRIAAKPKPTSIGPIKRGMTTGFFYIVKTTFKGPKMEKAKLTRSEAAIQLIAFADEKMDLTDQEAAAALTLAACFLAGGNAENILSIIRLVFATADVMRET